MANNELAVHLYRCGTKRCRERGKEQQLAVSPRECRQFTGRAPCCPACGGVLSYNGERRGPIAAALIREREGQ